MGKPSKEKTAIIQMLEELNDYLETVKTTRENYIELENIAIEKIKMLNELLNTNKEQK